MKRKNEMQKENAKQVLKNNGKSFYFAGLFLGKKRLEEMSILYQFCRYIDDEIDEGELTTQKIDAVKKIKEDLSLQKSDSMVVSEFIKLAQSKNISIKAAQDLVDGVLSDTNEVWIANREEFDDYCYKVAGTVGVMSCPILGTQNKDAIKFATDLGKAMQITNICRDIVEDANNDRIYIPQSLHDKDIRQSKDFENTSLALIVKTLLEDAEKLYSNSEHGLAYLPFRSKLAIFIAMHLYREIGRKIKRNNFDFFSNRVFTTKLEKLSLAIKATFFCFLNPKLWIKRSYDFKSI